MYFCFGIPFLEPDLCRARQWIAAGAMQQRAREQFGAAVEAIERLADALPLQQGDEEEGGGGGDAEELRGLDGALGEAEGQLEERLARVRRRKEGLMRRVVEKKRARQEEEARGGGVVLFFFCFLTCVPHFSPGLFWRLRDHWRPHALHRMSPLGPVLHSGVVLVPQWPHTGFSTMPLGPLGFLLALPPPPPPPPPGVPLFFVLVLPLSSMKSSSDS